LIYSTAFDSLPHETKSLVGKRLREILSVDDAADGAAGQRSEGKFSHLTAADRRAIREILEQTKPGLLKP
jgi:hypothetical protein